MKIERRKVGQTYFSVRGIMELPHDISAETGVICSLILYPNFALECTTLKEGHFYDIKNGVLYWSILKLVEKGVMKIDWQNISTQIKTDEDRHRIIGKDINDQVEEITENAHLRARESVDEYKQLVNRVVGLGFKRRLYQEIKKIENKCLTESTNDIAQINGEITSIMDNLAVDYISDEEIKSFADKVDHLWDKVKENRNPDGTFGSPPKWECLKEFFTYQNGELVLYCARRKAGKSVIALNEVVRQLKQGEKVVYFDTEMSDVQFFTRLLSHITQIPEKDIKSGNYGSEQRDIIENAKLWIKKQPLIHEYDPKWTKEKIITKCKILHNQEKLTFFIYDYFKDTSGKTISSSEIYNELGNWCDSIKNSVLGALDIKGIAFAQLNRENRIADSDKIERYCSTGILWRKKTPEEIQKDGQECGNYLMQVMFNRIGGFHDEDDYCDMVFRGEILTIEECKKQHNKNVTPYDE